MTTATFNIPKTAMRAKDWKKINNCCGPVVRIEWAKGRAIWTCRGCRRIRAMEKDGEITWKEGTEK